MHLLKFSLHFSHINIAEPLFIFILSLFTRFYKLCEPACICWDETHFGKFASFYLKSENYFDVHPPLGKMMLAMFGHISGYNGSFSFQVPGQDYGEISYCGIRGYCALLGAFIPTLLYLTISLQISRRAGILCAFLLICDTGLITLTQFILLESPLFFFLVANLTLYQLTQYFERYSKSWFLSMVLCGFSLGCILSVKYIGVFTVLYTGFMVIEDIWQMVSNKKCSMCEVMKYITICAISLIAIPILLYLLFFVIHFRFTRISTDADSSYSPSYQASLVDNKVSKEVNSQYLRFGNTIRLRNGEFLLHSHHLTFPDIELNQVTGYGHRDNNNQWAIEKCAAPGRDLVISGDMVKLRHLATNRYISTLPQYSAALTPGDSRVVTVETPDFNSCYQIKHESVDNIKFRVFQSDISLVSISNKCALNVGNSQLPEYGAKQLEVSCMRRYYKKPRSVLFALEHNISPVPEENSEKVPVAGILDKYLELQAKMLATNNALLPSETEASSRPWMWPINYEGLWFAITEKHGAVYFLGNPIIFWTNLVSIFLLTYINIHSHYLHLRGKVPYNRVVLTQCNWYLAGYLLHYVPFYLMGRVLYFHHFYSAFLFNTMLTAGLFELLFDKQTGILSRVVFGLSVSVFVCSFVVFSPLAYGIPVNENKQTYGYMKSLKWLDSWAF